LANWLRDNVPVLVPATLDDMKLNVIGFPARLNPVNVQEDEQE